jgi:hypothetical protein
VSPFPAKLGRKTRYVLLAAGVGLVLGAGVRVGLELSASRGDDRVALQDARLQSAEETTVEEPP